MCHEAPSDPIYEPDCTFWTHDEAAILHGIAASLNYAGPWVDIGARFGWTAAALISAGVEVIAVDPHLAVKERRARFFENLAYAGLVDGLREVAPVTAAEFFAARRDSVEASISGFVIDGNHDHPEPIRDALGAIQIAPYNCVIVFHDFWGRPIRDAVNMLLDTTEFRCRVYDTPNGVAACWRGFRGWSPPDHVPDPAIAWKEVRASQAPDFNFGRCQ